NLNQTAITGDGYQNFAKSTLIELLPVNTNTIVIDGIYFSAAGTAIDASNATAIISNCNFSELYSPAGVISSNRGELTISTCTFGDNITYGFAGIIHLNEASILLDRCRFNNNTGNNTVALAGCALSGNNYEAVIANSTFYSN